MPNPAGILCHKVNPVKSLASPTPSTLQPHRGVSALLRLRGEFGSFFRKSRDTRAKLLKQQAPPVIVLRGHVTDKAPYPVALALAAYGRILSNCLASAR